MEICCLRNAPWLEDAAEKQQMKKFGLFDHLEKVEAPLAQIYEALYREEREKHLDRPDNLNPSLREPFS
jgi:hypothetical protein